MSYEQAVRLELVCVGCGGPVLKALTRSFTFTRKSSSDTAQPPSRSARHGETCADGTVKLTRPNPFRQDLPKVGES
jgi:hypothetical protein